MLKEKSIGLSIILTFLTCGIYGIIWFANITDDLAFASGDHSISGGKAFLFTLLTCGIYYFFWSYKMGVLAYEAKHKKGLRASDNGVLYLILAIFGLGLINYCLLQSDINELAYVKE